MRTRRLPPVALLASALAAGACRTAPAPAASAPIVQPGAPGQPSRTVAAADATVAPRFTDADVKFMQGMIHHHAQALDMTALLKTRTNGDDMRTLAQRTELSQGDEIQVIQKWLEGQGQDRADEHAHQRAAAP